MARLRCTSELHSVPDGLCDDLRSLLLPTPGFRKRGNWEPLVETGQQRQTVTVPVNQVGAGAVRRQLGAFQVMKELQSAEHGRGRRQQAGAAQRPVGSVFCGLDFIYFIRRLTDDHSGRGARMAEAIRYAPLSTGGLAEPDPAAGGLLPGGQRPSQVHPCPREGRPGPDPAAGVSSPEMSDESGEGSPPGKMARPLGMHPGPRGHQRDPDPMMGLLP